MEHHVEVSVDGCTLRIAPDTPCWQLAARYGRFHARARGLDDDAAPALVLARGGRVVARATLAASLVGAELHALGADGKALPPPLPPPPAPRGEADWRDATSSDDDAAAPLPRPPPTIPDDDRQSEVLGPVDDGEARWRQAASDDPAGCWGRLQALETAAGDDRDPICDELVQALKPLDVKSVWDDRNWLGGTGTLREATQTCAAAPAVQLCVDGYDAAKHAPREAGLQPDFEAWPANRDDAGMFAVFGYPHVSACVMGSLLATARPTVPWRVVAGPSYACVLGRGFIIDACAASYKYDAARALAEDVRNGVFEVVPALKDGSHALRVGWRVAFKRRPMPVWAGRAPGDEARDTLTLPARLETLPNRDTSTRLRYLRDDAGGGPLGDDHRTAVPLAAATRWLEHRQAGNDAFRERDFEGALQAYDAALDALRRCTNVEGDLVPLSPLNRRRSAVATVLGNRAACHVELDRPSEALADCRAAKAWWRLLGKEALDTLGEAGQARRAKLEARRRRLAKAKKSATVVLVTEPRRRPHAERIVRCFLSQEYSEPLELLVIDDDDGSAGEAPEFWTELLKRDRRIRYVKLPPGTSLGEKRRVACTEAQFSTLVHFSCDAVYAPDYVQWLTEAAADVVCLGAWHAWDTQSGRGGYAQFEDRVLRAAVADRAQLLKQGAIHGGFGLCYARKVAERLFPFERGLDADAAFLKACLDAEDVTVCSIRDAGALALQVLPSAVRTVALTSCAADYLAASPVGKLVELASADAPAKRGLFVWDAEVLAAGGDEVAAGLALDAWNRSDAGFLAPS